MSMHKWTSRAFLLALCLFIAAGSASAYDYNGVKWDPQTFPIIYYVNSEGAPDGFADLVQECFNQYHRVPTSALSFRFSGLNTRSLDPSDGFSIVIWDATGAFFETEEPVDPTLPPPPPVPAKTLVRTNAEGVIVEADTVINGTLNWATSGEASANQYDLKTAILREVGRWVQLEYLTDIGDANKVMYDPLQPGAVRQALSQDEINAINEIYPAQHVADAYETGDNTCSGATFLASFDPDTGEYIGTPQSDHNIYPYDDVDWYTFTLTEPKSIRIATSGPDPLGDTEIYLYDSCPVGDPIGHADDIQTPKISVPTTPSDLQANGSYTFRVNVDAGTVNVNNQLFEIAAREDVVIDSGTSTPINETDSAQLYSVVAVENGGAFTIQGIPGAAAPPGSVIAPTEDEIDAAVGHTNWVMLGETLFQLDGLIRQKNTFYVDTQHNINVQLMDPTTPSSYTVGGGYEFRVDSNGGAIILNNKVYFIPKATDFVVDSGTEPILSGDNTSIVYTVVARPTTGNNAELVSVVGTPAPSGTATGPADTAINDAVGSADWVRIGDVQIDFSKINQSIRELPFDANRAASRFYAVLDASGLPAGTYYVQVQSSVAGGRPIVDPYSIVLLPGAVDVYEYDNLPEDAKLITPGETQDRSINPVGDVDWAYFTLSEPAHVVLETFGESGGDTYLELWDESGSIATNQDKADGDWYSRIEVPKLPAGTYHVLVEDEFGIYTIANYQLAFTATEAIGDLYEHDNTPEQASQFTDTLTTQMHTIDPIGDHDWISFDLTEMAKGVEIETTGLENDDLYLELYDSSILSDPNAAPIASDDNSGLNSYAKISYFGPAEAGLDAGTYYVLVRQKDDAALTGEYEVSLRVVAQGGDSFELDDTPAYANELPLNQAQQHSITAGGDVDWVKFAIETSGTISLETSGPQDLYDLGSDTDMYLYQYIGGGASASMSDLQLIASNNDIDTDGGNYWSKIDYPGTMPGTYYVQILHGWDTVTPIDPYYITATFTEDPRETNDPGDTPDGALLLIDGVTSSGHTISPVTDIDWYKINVDKLSDLTVDITVNGAVDVSIYNDSVLTGSSTPLATGSDYYTLSLRAVDLNPGTYYIKVIELGDNQLVDDYSVTGTLVPAPDFRVRPPSMFFRGDWQTLPEPVAATVRHLNNTTTWSAAADVDWIIVTPSSGSVSPSADADIQVSVDIKEFPKGTQTGNITFTAADGSDPYVVPVTMEITADPADIQWDSTNLTFNAVEGAIDPDAQALNVTNAGGGDNIDWSIDSSASWLTITPNSGKFFLSAPSSLLTIQPNVAGLAPGTYTTNIVIHGLEASPGAPPVQPQVTFTVTADSVVPSPATSAFSEGPHGTADTDSISMTATETVDDQLAPVEYYFEFMGGDSGGADSGWISSNTFELSGLVPGGYYTYRVKARDTSSNHNETSFSEKTSGYVAPVAPPAPQIGTAGFNTIDISVSRGSNSPRVNLAIYNVTDGTYVGKHGEPQQEPAWRFQEEWGTTTVSGLYGGKEYAFKVMAANGQGLQSDFGPEAIGYTMDNAPPDPGPTFDAPGVAPHFEDVNVTMTCTEAIDQSQPVLYYFEYVGPAGEGQDSGWQSSRTYTTLAVQAGGEYAFRVKAKDANGFETDYSNVAAAYRQATTPKMLVYYGMTDSSITIGIADDDNSPAVEYAIMDSSKNLYVDETGFLGSVDPVWQTREEWGEQITAVYGKRSPAPLKVKARNGVGDETAFGPTLLNPITGGYYYIQLDAVPKAGGGYSWVTLPDTTPPAPNPIRWAAGTPTNVTSSGLQVAVVTAIDSNSTINYEFFNVTTGTSSGWGTSTGHTFMYLDPCTQYEFKARAKDGASHVGDWSESLSVYTKPAVPGMPALANTPDGKAFIDINANGNGDAAEYAIAVTSLGTYVSADGLTNSVQKVWQTKEEWSNTFLGTLAESQKYSFAVYARNPDGVETGMGPELSNITLDYTPPQPNPPAIRQYMAAGTQVYLVSTTGVDISPVSYYFDSVDDKLPDSGWSNLAFYNYYNTEAAGIMAKYRVKIRDAAGNETDWSETVEFPTTPLDIDPPVAIGSAEGKAFISIQRGSSAGINSIYADFAVIVYDSIQGIDYYVKADGTRSTQPFYQPYTDWGPVVTILNPPTILGTAYIKTKVRSPAGSNFRGPVPAVVLESDDVMMTVQTTADTTAPAYSSLGFSEIPVDTGTTWISMTALPCQDPAGVMYGFEYQGGTIDWVWTDTYTAENLTPGATYSFRMRAKDGAGNMTPYSGYTQASTLAAVPGTPTAVAGAVQMQVTIDTAGNAAGVQYAIYDSASSKYLAADGALTSGTPVWKTLAEWGQPVIVTGLQPDDHRVISVKAMNPDGVETAFSPATEAQMSSYDGDAPTPDPMAFAVWPYATSTTSIKAEAVAAQDQTGPVEYYFRVTGEAGAAPRGWTTSNVYELTGLVPGGKYTFQVQARDASVYPQQNYTEWSAPVDVYVNPQVPGQPIAGEPTTSGVDLSFTTGANSPETLYAIRDTRTGKYVSATGALASYQPVWRSAAQWGSTVSVSGLKSESTYYFVAVARSKDEVESAYTAETMVETGTGWPIEGDANLDCKVNIIDLIFVRNRLNKDVTSGDNWQADVNSDGRVNIIDLIYIRNRLNNRCQ